MNKPTFYAILFCAFLFYKNVTAQQVLANSGATLQNTNGSISFTLGEMLIETKSNSTVIITQGFHQSKIIITAVNELQDLNLSVMVYPNPTSDKVTLKVEKTETKDMEYFLYDLSGKQLYSAKMYSNEAEIPFSQFPPSTYILKVLINGKEIKIFKIVKQ